MQVGTSGSQYYSPNTSGGGGSNTATTDSQFAALLGGGGDNSDDPAAILKKITSNGMTSLWSWQIDQMKKDVAQQVMGERGVTAAQIAAMPADQRAQLEQSIMQEVAQRVKQLVEQDMKKKQQDPLGGGLTPTAAAPSGGGDIGSLLDISA